MRKVEKGIAGRMRAKPSNKLEVRMQPDLLAALRQQAKEMGYSSAPAYVRAWAAGEVRQPSKTQSLDLNRASALALRYIELLLAARSPQAPNVDVALEWVRRQLVARSWTAHMKKLSLRDRS